MKKPDSLTDIERLLLRNQFAILERLDAGDNAKYYARCREILEWGYTTEYGNIFAGDWCDEMQEQDCQYVKDVLSLYTDLQRSFDDLEDKGGLVEEDVVFPGFGESANKLFARFIRVDNHWRSLRVSNEDMDGHFPNKPQYRQMLNKMSEIESTKGVGGRYQLTTDEIKSILPKRARPASTATK
jgi:uncharacterized protein YfbU (UPF0304 family)